MVGGGVIGLGIAWRCLQRGLDVTVVDPAPGSGASWTAAGMLAPVTELHYGEQALLGLNLESAARYPAFAADLEAATGRPVGYRPSGTVVAAWDAADLAALRDLAAFAATLGRRCEMVTGRELRRLVPQLASGLPGGMVAQDDHQVDNRLLHAALLAAVGDRLIRSRVTRVTDDGVHSEDGPIRADTVVLAAGAQSRRIGGLPDLPAVRPVKGQTLRVRLPADERLARIVRGSVKGNPIYLVPRENGELVIGATSEEVGYDTRPRAGAVYELLRDAQTLLPVIAEAELTDISTGLRPGSPDNAPIVGRVSERLIVATGHYRNGVLLTPVTADGVADLITTGELPPELRPFTPDRFHAEARS